MAFSIRKSFGKKKEITALRPDLEPRDDIKRDNLDVDAEKDEQNFRFSSLLDHIKKNWSDLKSFNKKI